MTFLLQGHDISLPCRFALDMNSSFLRYPLTMLNCQVNSALCKWLESYSSSQDSVQFLTSPSILFDESASRALNVYTTELRISSGAEKSCCTVIAKAGIPRPLWNAASQILMAVGYILMAVALPGSLYIGSVVVGICYGVRLAVSVPTASELFGLKYFGLIYNILILNLPLGSFLFSGLLAGLLYDAEATPRHQEVATPVSVPIVTGLFSLSWLLPVSSGLVWMFCWV
ncbi:putative NODULIN-LIKE PROTEIN [Salix koriyanagi]|uniref:NODULIN-LIKE PROTEIN n=1 Tax=Salix koriyanagi TaxID=2511006 RepID=A0A9Q0V050_9ROSI|nr:putative NODULIN-LIKE PROTEIN [Salix koriyanagi]